MQTLDEPEVRQKLYVVLTMIEQQGEKVLICRNGKPIADLTPHNAAANEKDDGQQLFAPSPLQRLKQIKPAGIVLPTKKLKKAVMPTITVTGKPLSQIILEDRAT